MGFRGSVLSEVNGIDFDPAILTDVLARFEVLNSSFSSLLDLAAISVL